jgi:hypothetical protein
MNENDFVYSLTVEQRKAYWQLRRENQNKIVSDILWAAECVKENLECEERSGACSVIEEINKFELRD